MDTQVGKCTTTKNSARCGSRMPVADPLYLGAAALAGLASVGVGYWLLSRRRPNLPGLKFIYFPVASRGDAMRLALTLNQVPYEDKRIAPSEWMALKPSTPWGSLPYVELADGTHIGQSKSILRYIGKGTGLYPQDALLAALVDECIDGCDAMAITTNSTGQGLPGPEKVAKRGAGCKQGGGDCHRLPWSQDGHASRRHATHPNAYALTRPGNSIVLIVSAARCVR